MSREVAASLVYHTEVMVVLAEVVVVAAVAEKVGGEGVEEEEPDRYLSRCQTQLVRGPSKSFESPLTPK